MSELITIGISLVTSIIVAWITSKIAFRSDIKKYLHSKRETLYFDLYEHVDKLLINASMIYNDDYKEKLYSFKPALKLIASKAVINAYKDIYFLCNEYNYKLDEFTLSNDPINCIDFESIENEDGTYDEIPHNIPTDFEFKYYEDSLRNFKENNIPTSKELSRIINTLTDAMRNDIGSKKINW